MQFENNCVSATSSSVAAMYNRIIIINRLCIIANVLPYNSNDALLVVTSLIKYIILTIIFQEQHIIALMTV